MLRQFIFYIHFDIFRFENFLDDNIEAFMNRMNILFEVARHLKADVYFAAADVLELKSYFENFDENFTQSQGNKLDVLLKDFIVNNEINHFFKVLFSDQNTSLEYYPLSALNSKAKEEVNILFSLDNENKIFLLGVKSNDVFFRLEINPFNDSKAIWKFINEALPDKRYNFSAKHGNATTKAIPPKSLKASQLKCSNDEAQKLLDNAIFDLRENNWGYYFDEIQKTYIVFPFEGITPQNQYHAFHIEQDEWDNEIPNSIRKYFEK